MPTTAAVIKETVNCAFQVLRHLPDTARYSRGQTVGITQEGGRPIVGTILNINHRTGTITVTQKGNEREITAPANEATLLFDL